MEEQSKSKDLDIRFFFMQTFTAFLAFVMTISKAFNHL